MAAVMSISPAPARSRFQAPATIAGATTVAAGTLNVTGSLQSAITVQSGGSMSGNGSTNQLLTLNGGSFIIGTVAGFTANGVALANVGVNKVNIVDGSGLTGAHTVDVVNYGAGGFASGLAGFGGVATATQGSDVATATLAAYRGGVLHDTGSQITLSYTSGTRTWNSGLSVWDNMNTTAWQEGDKKFSGGDAVIFNDTGIGAGALRAS